MFLHVANTLRTKSVSATIQIEGQTAGAGRVFEIAADPMVELSYLNSADVMKIVEKPLAAGGAWEFPAASVSAVELEMGVNKDDDVPVRLTTPGPRGQAQRCSDSQE